MKYHSSARPSTVGKSIRIRTFSATLVYPVSCEASAEESSEQKQGKRIRSRRVTKGKYDRRRPLKHLEWCLEMRAAAKRRKEVKTSTGLVGARSHAFRRFTRALARAELYSPHSLGGLSGGTGTKVNMSQLRAYAARQVFLQTWPARVVVGVQTFFSRLREGSCLHCGNHSGKWGFWVFGCHQHAVREVSRLEDAASVVISVLNSLEYRVPDDFEAVLWCRQSLVNLSGQWVRLQERFFTIWGGLATLFMPSVLRRGYRMSGFVTDMARLGVIVGSDNPVDMARKFVVPSQRSLVKSLASQVVPRDPAHVLRELVGRKQCGDLLVLLTNPDQFVLNTKRVQELFARLGEAELTLPIDFDRVFTIKNTPNERDLLFVLDSLYQGEIPNYRRKVGELWRIFKVEKRHRKWWCSKKDVYDIIGLFRFSEGMIQLSYHFELDGTLVSTPWLDEQGTYIGNHRTPPPWRRACDGPGSYDRQKRPPYQHTWIKLRSEFTPLEGERKGYDGYKPITLDPPFWIEDRKVGPKSGVWYWEEHNCDHISICDWITTVDFVGRDYIWCSNEEGVDENGWPSDRWRDFPSVGGSH